MSSTAPIDLSERARALLASPPPAVPLAPAEPLATPGVMAAIDALDRHETHYTDRPGIAALRKVIAARLSLGGLAVTAADVIVTCGIEEARFVTATILGAQQAISGETEALQDLAKLAGLTLAQSSTVTWSSGAGPQGPVNGISVYELGTATQIPASALGACGTVILGLLPEAGHLRTGFLACSGFDPKALRDFKQALTICTTNLSQWIALGLLEAEDAA